MALDRLLAALSAPGTAEELSGLEAATAAFTRVRADAAPTSHVAVGGRTRRSVAAGVAVAAVLATVSVGAAAAAAYTGSLPGPLQAAAHAVIGAPAPESPEAAATDERTGDASPSSASGSSHGNGPAVTPGAPALFGLCTAFRDRGPSAVPTDSVAYRDLLAAATAAKTDIAGYCAGVLPGGSHGPSGTPGSPTARPTPSGKATPDARPTPSRRPSGDQTTPATRTKAASKH